MKKVKPKVLFSKEEIQKRTKELGHEISEYFKKNLQEDDSLIVIGVLKGAYIFTADLVRELDVAAQIEFVRIASYGDNTQSSNVIKAPDLSLPSNIYGKNILLVEDIVDTGQTSAFLKKYIEEQFKPSKLVLVSLLNKPSRREVQIEPDFYGFEIEDKFVIGYGLDFAEKYRELDYLGELEGRLS